MISRAAADWNAGLATTATVQLMPGQGLELQSQAAAALDILRSTEGVAGAELMSLEETQALIEPWVGASDAIADLPMPRLITVRFAPDRRPRSRTSPSASPRTSPARASTRTSPGATGWRCSRAS